ncbi:putative peptidoglycan binding protein [Rhodoglobus vestalii]|uniref:Putative peptidoglycan binding protein n=1 Tax=Rhodoglobus vestalii TaxID=193384 RepID=A0A8H2K3W2_9MICO|nr:peptidoglycan-binding domain-containing protein [Rhodoglobus vestalii]TQO19650.1 putative peptidoglycan binding protein [Rhodoglobus vestalii]
MVAASGVAWASATVLAPPSEVLSEVPFTFVAAEYGEVGSSLTLNAAAEWHPEPNGTNLAAGTVTTVDVANGDEVVLGQRVYSVDLRPVFAARGDIPAFRDLSRGLTGPDVMQLQELLIAAGTYTGPADGEFYAGTERAVEAWQLSQGVEVDGSVRRSDIIFISSLPTRVAVSDELVRGASLVGGEIVMSGLGSVPNFTIPIGDGQSGLISDGDRVEISAPDGSSWEAKVANRLIDENGQLLLILMSTSDASICDLECGAIPVGDPTLLESRVITQEPEVGVVIPSAAFLVKADGEVVVVDRDGAEHVVSVVASSRGMSVVDGIDVGLFVQVPASE